MLRSASSAVSVGGAVVAAAMVVGTAIAPTSPAGLALTGLGFVGVLAVLLLSLSRFESVILGALVIRIALDGLKGSGPIDPATGLGAAFIVATAANLSQRALSHRLHPIHPAFKLFGLYVALEFVAAAIGAHTVTSLIAATKILAGLAMFVAIEQHLRDDPRFASRVSWAVVASLAIPGLAATYQFATNTGNHETVGYNRILGTAVHPTSFASYLLLVIVAALAMWTQQGRRGRVALGWVVAWGLFLLLFTYTRSAWLSGVVGVLYVVSRLNWRWLVPIGGAGVLVVQTVPQITARFSDLTNHVGVSSTASANSLDWRKTYWQEILPLVKGHQPFGIGLDATALDSPQALPPHDILIQSWVETGVAGSVLLALLAVAFAVAAHRRRKAATTRLERVYAVSMAAAGLMFIGQGLASNVLTQTMLYWYLAGVACIGYSVSADRSTTPTTVHADHRPTDPRRPSRTPAAAARHLARTE